MKKYYVKLKDSDGTEHFCILPGKNEMTVKGNIAHPGRHVISIEPYNGQKSFMIRSGFRPYFFPDHVDFERR